MFAQLGFYIRHSVNDLHVNGRRTFFALLCIAAGVAAVVSLQTLVVMISDTLNGNLQATNRSDIQLQIPTTQPTQPGGTTVQDEGVKAGVLQRTEQSFFGNTSSTYSISLAGVQQIKDWLNQTYPGQVSLTYRIDLANLIGIFGGTGVGTAVTATGSGNAASQVTPILIEPGVYPFYYPLTSTDGKTLAELIQKPTDIVLDTNMAEKLAAKTGDIVRLNGANIDFTVRGIVPTKAEVSDPLNDVLVSMFGFYYLDTNAVQYFSNVAPQISRVYLKLDQPDQGVVMNANLIKTFPYLKAITLDDLAAQNKAITDQIGQLVTIMGLVSLLLGSIGIVNTMQVVVRRRMVEIAVLKTLGLQAEEITLLFLIEAFLMGIVGSLFGILLGWVVAFLIKGVAQSLLAQTLTFHIAFGPALNGLVVGTLITTIFGFLPTLAAGQVRPAVVLRPTGELIPRAGWLRTLFVLVVIIVALSLVAQTMLGSFSTALAITVITFITAGILYVVLSLLIWLIGRFFPSLGNVDLKIALRQMLAGRSRSAITLLSLVVGVFSLSLVTLFADATNNLMKLALNQASGGNVLVTLSSDQTFNQVQEAISKTDGVKDYTVSRSYQMTFVSLQEPDGSVLNTDQIKARIKMNLDKSALVSMFGGSRSNNNQVDAAQSALNSLATINGVNSLPPQNSSTPSFRSGRAFTAADAGKPVLIVVDNTTTQAAGLRVGDKLTYALGKTNNAPSQTFEVIGIEQSSLISIGTSGNLLAPYDAFPSSFRPVTVQLTVDIDEKQINALRRRLSAIPGTFVLETAALTQLVSGLLDTFTAFPSLIALLSLIVSGIVIANSVALTTMERQREIAVMKAIGLQRERVLAMLLLENGILGFIGGLIGVGIGILILTLIVSVSGSGVLRQAIPYGTALLLMLLCVVITRVAAATTAWGASGEKPLNVLRFE